MRVVDPADGDATDSSPVLARMRQGPHDKAAALAQSLAAEGIAEAVAELRRQVREGLSESARLKAALELVRIATVPAETGPAEIGAEDEEALGGQLPPPQAPQVVIIDLKEAARIAKNYDGDS